LLNNGLKYIVRVKGDGKYFTNQTKLRPSNYKYNEIINIKNNSKMVTYKDNIKQIVYTSKGKKASTKKYALEIKNDCNLITNLLNEELYTNEKILDMYRSRWDIEVYFKYLKSNYNFRHIKEKSQTSINKTYICGLIITYIEKIIEEYYIEKYLTKKQKKGYTYKINKSNLTYGVFDYILKNMFKNNITKKN